MLTQDQLDSFWENGFLHISNVFDPELMDKLDGMILDHFGMNPELDHEQNFLENAQVEVVPWFPQREGVTSFDEVENSAFLEDATKQILGEGWGRQYCMIMFSKAGSAGQAWHQDCPADNTKMFNLNRLVYTADIRPEIGGRVVVRPATYKKGPLTVGDPHEDIEDQVVLQPRKGDVVFLHGHTWHRITPVTSHFRSSVNFRSGPQGVPEDITDICAYRNMYYQFSTASVLEHRV